MTGQPPDVNPLELVSSHDLIEEIIRRYDAVVFAAFKFYRAKNSGHCVVISGSGIVAAGLINLLDERMRIMNQVMHFDAECEVNEIIEGMVSKEADDDDDGSDAGVPAGDGG